MFTFVALLFLLSAHDVALVSASSSSSEEEAVISKFTPVLNETEFNRVVMAPNSGLTFVMFFLPYCPACKMFKSYWETVGKRLQNHIDRVIKYDCDNDEDVCFDLCVPHFPYFAIIENGKLIAENKEDFDDGVLIDWYTSGDFRKRRYRPRPRVRGRCPSD